MHDARNLRFVGAAIDDLRSFPPSARQQAGRQLRRLQIGLAPSDWKPMKRIGAGASEIRIRQDRGAFRVIYVAKFEEAIYVLHCFRKKTQTTSRADIDLAKRRYKALIAIRRHAD